MNAAFYEQPANIFMFASPTHPGHPLFYAAFYAAAWRRIERDVRSVVLEGKKKWSRKLIDPFIFIIKTRVSRQWKERCIIFINFLRFIFVEFFMRDLCMKIYRAGASVVCACEKIFYDGCFGIGKKAYWWLRCAPILAVKIGKPS